MGQRNKPATSRVAAQPTSPNANSVKRVALGMSGGVDSSLCAHLLKEQGFDVTGVFLECWRAPGCRVDQDRADALNVALDLNLPFQVLDFKEAYRQKVVEYFFEEYQAGRTPNPDILCNQEIKYGLFYDWAMANGFDYVATGHYAKISPDHTQLLVPADQHKDQTYFLYRIRPDQIPHLLYPLGEMTKPQVRQEATKRGLKNATKPDSVGICFIGDIDVKAFLKERLGENQGEVVDVKGNVIGQHKGLWFYTIGQRHGFEINKKSFIATQDGQLVEKENIPPFYVVSKNAAKNQLVVGFGADTYAQEFLISQANWLVEPNNWLIDQNQTEAKLLVRIRHTGQLLPATFAAADQKVTLLKPAQGLAAGQSAVLYLQTPTNTVCLGGGVIEQPVLI